MSSSATETDLPIFDNQWMTAVRCQSAQHLAALSEQRIQFTNVTAPPERPRPLKRAARGHARDMAATA